ncbi:bacteriochlorophyll 4-vinyl reductase [Heliobacterium mobile]|uniref:4-vinyl reductase BchJ n=1 Tax=Heliobacterium mobile TaxID=28064 RepID=Q9ZGF5_HELMO|nr:bacteriochlorophyll 4-vinyl reductase [Heliobacterium mobile]AAC84023.1 4-vinyl reductase BchJ [Heliobacterium mobile]
MSDIGNVNYGKIGPNSIIQTVAALKEKYGDEKADVILRQGGKGYLIDNLPSEMVDEKEFISLVHMLASSVGHTETKVILRRSGELTAKYLLKHRIPGPIQWLLKVLPAKQGLRILLSAISKNAWTFVGTGTFSYDSENEKKIYIENCLSCRGLHSSQPICSFYEGTFEKLIQTLIVSKAQVREIECIALGAKTCTYQIQFPK